MKGPWWVALGFLAACELAASPAAAQRSTPLSFGDLFRLRTLSSPEISPDARHIAYLETRPDIVTDRRLTRLRIIDLRDGSDRLIGTPDSTAGQPRWSADGRLAYVSTTGSDIHIAIVDPDGGSPRMGAALPHYPQGLAWSPDGRQFAYIAQRADAAPAPTLVPPPGATWSSPAFVTETAGFQTFAEPLAGSLRFDLFAIDASSDARPRQILDAPVAYSAALVRSGLQWTPDGKQVLFAANPGRDFWRNALASDVFAASLSGGTPRRISAAGESSYGPVASPDGRSIAYLCWGSLELNYIRHDICLFDRGTGIRRRLPNKTDQRISSLRWAADSGSLYGSFEERGRIKVAQFDLVGNYQVLAETGGGDLSAYTGGADISLSRDETLAYVASDAARPGDVAVLRAGNISRIATSANVDLLKGRRLGRVEEIDFPSVDRRFAIHAVVTKPPGFDPARRYPLFVMLHGGRSLAYGPDFDLIAQMFAANGYVVVMPNYRSSGSFGTAFADGAPTYPTGMNEDVEAAVDAMIARGYVDPERLFIGGGSGGGVITAWTIGHSNRFRAAAMWFASVDWASNNLEAASGFSTSSSGFGGQPWENRAEYAARSPLTLVGKVATPTLLIVGDQDRITPVSQSIMYFNALQFRGIPSQLQIVPGEAHGVDARPSHELALIKATIDWFARFGGTMDLRPTDFPAPGDR